MLICSTPTDDDARPRARSAQPLAQKSSAPVSTEVRDVSNLAVASILRRQISTHAVRTEAATAIPRLTLRTGHVTASGEATLLQPVVCLVVQGEKRVSIGSTTLRLAAGDCLLTSLDVPASGGITPAAAHRPFLSVGLALDRELIAQVSAGMASSEHGHAAHDTASTSVGMARATRDQLVAFARLLALLDEPAAIPLLAPLRERELMFRLLQGELGARLRMLALEDGAHARIRRAIVALRDRYDQPLPIADLARAAGMSAASFHRHFGVITGMSPLQYQKVLRLRAARQLLASGRDVSSTGFDVGYSSSSQFSREYRRFFGIPPSRDVARVVAANARLLPVRERAVRDGSCRLA